MVRDSPLRLLDAEPRRNFSQIFRGGVRNLAKIIERNIPTFRTKYVPPPRLAGGWQNRLHGNPPEMEGERPQDASNGAAEEEVRLRGVDGGYLRGIRVLLSA